MSTQLSRLRLFRDELQARIEAYFDSQQIDKVSTPEHLAYPAPEPNLNPVQTKNGWYRTSPELELKKLVAKNNRMLEWYRVNGSLEQLQRDLAKMLAIALEVAEATHFRHRGIKCNPKDAWLYRTARQISPSHNESEFYQNLQAQPKAVPLVVSDWHLEHQMMAQIKANTMKRLELYVCGVELANGCMELADPHQASEFLNSWQRQTKRPFDPAYIKTTKNMEGVAGIALGFDRLVMLALGADNINNVIW